MKEKNLSTTFSATPPPPKSNSTFGARLERERERERERETKKHTQTKRQTDRQKHELAESWRPN
jgi:hypothetical protein